MLWKVFKSGLGKLITIVLTLTITLLLKGEDFKGLPALKRYWYAAVHSTVPLWLFLVVAMMAAVSLQTLIPKLLTRKSDTLHIVPGNPGLRQWAIGAYGKTPAMQVTVALGFAHSRENFSYVIRSAYLDGTEPVLPLVPEVVVDGPYDQEEIVHLIVAPVIGRSGKPLRRRIVFVDQFNQRHTTQKLTFRPAVNPKPVCTSQPPPNCLFCNKPLIPEDFVPEAAIPAHAACIWKQ